MRDLYAKYLLSGNHQCSNGNFLPSSLHLLKINQVNMHVLMLTRCYMFAAPAALGVRTVGVWSAVNCVFQWYWLKLQSLWLLQLSCRIEKPPNYSINDAFRAQTCQGCPRRVSPLWMSCSCVFPRAQLCQGSSTAHSLTSTAPRKERVFNINFRAPHVAAFCSRAKDAGPKSPSAAAPGPLYLTLMMQQKKAQERYTKTLVYSTGQSLHEPHVSLFPACAFTRSSPWVLSLSLSIMFYKIQEKNLKNKQKTKLPHVKCRKQKQVGLKCLKRKRG